MKKELTKKQKVLQSLLALGIIAFCLFADVIWDAIF